MDEWRGCAGKEVDPPRSAGGGRYRSPDPGRLRDTEYFPHDESQHGDSHQQRVAYSYSYSYTRETHYARLYGRCYVWAHSEHPHARHHIERSVSVYLHWRFSTPIRSHYREPGVRDL